MARLWTSGGEWNDITAEGVTVISGTPGFTTSSPRTGTYAFRNTAAGAFKRTFTGLVGTTYYSRQWIKLDSLPSAGQTQTISAWNDGTFAIGLVRVTETGTLQLIAKSATQVGSDSSAVTAGSYFMLETAILIAASTNDDYCEARLNGVSFASTTTANIGTAAPVDFRFSLVDAGTGVTGITVDDLALNDSSGASQTSWPGTGSVVLLRPTADSAVGTGWTLGNGTATGGNAWQRLDNSPPDSVTDLTTAADADQIRNATSNANTNYDATMTTYTAAGVTGTVNVVIPMVATGSISATSAKQGTVGVVSNPAITNVALAAGGVSGAFWSGVVMGTYATGNKWSFGTTTYAPSVTLGTAPVMRITQVTSSTRVAIVTEMGIYVDFTPAVVTASLVAGTPQRALAHRHNTMDRWN